MRLLGSKDKTDVRNRISAGVCTLIHYLVMFCFISDRLVCPMY